jgi:hypothetical protein
VTSSDQEDTTWDFWFSTYYTPSSDNDADGVGNGSDLCPGTPTGHAPDSAGCSDSQVDPDGDGVRSPGAPSGGPSGSIGADNCADVSNPGQHNSDLDGRGDACDDDNVVQQQLSHDSGANPAYPWGQVFTADEPMDDVVSFEFPACFSRIYDSAATVVLQEWPSGSILATAANVRLSHERRTIVGFPTGPVGLEIGSQYAVLVTSATGAVCKPEVELFLNGGPPGTGRFVSGGGVDTARDMVYRIFSSPGFDITAPRSTVGFPAHGVAYTAGTWDAGGGTPAGDITGTTGDGDGAGVSKVEVSVHRNGTGRYWDGSAFSAAGEVFHEATGTATWSLGFPSGNFPAEDSYTVHVRGTDALNQVEAGPSATFTIDTTAPTSAIAFPAEGSTYGPAAWDAGGGTPAGDITGTATDASGSGVQRVDVSIRRDGTGQYWNGSAFAAGTEAFHQATGTVSWSLAFPADNFTAGGSYTVHARATDNLGIVEASPTATFTINLDSVAPDVDLSFPTPAGQAGWHVVAPVVGAISANDTPNGGSNINGISCTGATVGTITGLGTPSASAAVSVSTQGTTAVSCTATDSVGNSGAGPGSTNTASVKLDSVAPAVSITGGAAPADGFLAGQTIATFPATVGSPFISAGGTVSDGTSGIASVVVNGVAATGTWTAGGIALLPGANTITATATDAAGNAAVSGSVSVTFDPDLDDDGIRNNVDVNPNTPSAAFSDVPLGGETAGTIQSRGGAGLLMVEDVASPQGVKVTTTTGSSSAPARISYKGGNILVSVPGSTVITDPDWDTTIEVLDGSAQLELSVNGSLLVIAIAEGAGATVSWRESNGVVSNVAIKEVTGDPGDVTMNGVAVQPGVFGTLSAGLSVTKGSFSFTGTFKPASSGDGVTNPLTEEVVLRLASYVFVVPAGRLRILSDGAYGYTGTTITGVKFSIQLRPAKGGGWSVKANGKSVSGLTNPVPVGFGIGNDAGFTAVPAALK